MIAASRTDRSKRLAASALGCLLDRFLGESPARLHPLRAFGGLMAWIERHFGFFISSTTGAAFLSCGGRALGEAAGTDDRALHGSDLATAREEADTLVGRDTEQLGESELARTAVESVAENTVDAVVAPLVFAAVGGAPDALGYRAANTLDALVGHHNQRCGRFGWARSRLDDELSFVPVRPAALLDVLVRPRRAPEMLRVVRSDAPAHPFPNASVAKAAFAAALGLRLGGESTYGGATENRPFHGDGRAPRHRPGKPSLSRRPRCSRGESRGRLAVAMRRTPNAHVHSKWDLMSSLGEVTTVVPPPSAHGGDAKTLAAVLRVAPSEILDLGATFAIIADGISR